MKPGRQVCKPFKNFLPIVEEEDGMDGHEFTEAVRRLAMKVAYALKNYKLEDAIGVDSEVHKCKMRAVDSAMHDMNMMVYTTERTLSLEQVASVQEIVNKVRSDKKALLQEISAVGSATKAELKQVSGRGPEKLEEVSGRGPKELQEEPRKDGTRRLREDSAAMLAPAVHSSDFGKEVNMFEQIEAEQELLSNDCGEAELRGEDKLEQAGVTPELAEQKDELEYAAGQGCELKQLNVEFKLEGDNTSKNFVNQKDMAPKVTAATQSGLWGDEEENVSTVSPPCNARPLVDGGPRGGSELEPSDDPEGPKSGRTPSRPTPAEEPEVLDDVKSNDYMLETFDHKADDIMIAAKKQEMLDAVKSDDLGETFDHKVGYIVTDAKKQEVLDDVKSDKEGSKNSEVHDEKSKTFANWRGGKNDAPPRTGRDVQVKEGTLSKFSTRDGQSELEVKMVQVRVGADIQTLCTNLPDRGNLRISLRFSSGDIYLAKRNEFNQEDGVEGEILNIDHLYKAILMV